MTLRRKRHPVVLYQPRDEGATMPLGLLAVGSSLSEAHVVVVDGRFELAPEARVVELAREASLLGVNVRTGDPLRDALRVSAAARTANPALAIVWGGPHATYAPESCLSAGVVDACARGAGEATLAAAVRCAREGGRLELAGVPGLVTRGGIVTRPLSPPAAERTPPAVYSLLDVERVFEVRGSRRLDYCASRGARGGATRWTGFPAERVLAEVGELAERYRLGEVLFQDEDFFADPERARAIAVGLADGAARLGWQASARASDVVALADEGLRALVAGGCHRLRLTVPPGVAAEAREQVLEAGARLHARGLAARFEILVAEAGARGAVLAAAVSLASSLSALDGRFETPLRRLAPVPPWWQGGADDGGLEQWVARANGPWPDARAERRLERASFFFREAQRAPGRRIGQHLLRLAALLRVRLGFFGLDLERAVVEASALLRTGRPRPGSRPD